jgi:hypothetical protein
MRIGALLLAITLVVACDRGNAPRERAAPPLVEKPKVAVATAATPWYLDDAEGCGFLRAQRFQDPLELARYYAEKDSAGVFLGTSPVADSVYLCPGHLPGPDAFMVVKDTKLRMLFQTDTTADVEFAALSPGYVTSDTSNHMELVPGPEAIVDTYHLVKTQYGWRVESPQLHDWVSGYTVVQQADTFGLRPSAVDSIKAFLARSGH